MALGEQMEIPSTENWHKTWMAQRMYPLGPKDRALADKILDELYQQKWANKLTPFSAPIFAT